MVFRSSARLISSIFSLRLNRNLQIWCFLSRVAISESDADNTITPLSSMVLAVSERNLASILKSGPEIKNRCTLKGISGKNLASIRKSGPEIKNRCTLMGISGENPASIRKSGPEIKNRCTLMGISGENPTSIRKSGPEIKNHCSPGVVAVCRRNHSPSRQRRLVSDADLVAATTVAGRTILCYRKEN